MTDTATHDAAQVKLCSRCEENPVADPDSKNPWCKECRAEYARGYQKTKLNREMRKGFASGAKRMQDYLALAFHNLGGGQFSGDEISDLILRAPLPTTDQAP
jgi:hypothetical protein